MVSLQALRSRTEHGRLPFVERRKILHITHISSLLYGRFAFMNCFSGLL